MRIAQRAATVHPGQRWLKRAYMELGGKDAQIVDETADLEAAGRRRCGCIRLPGPEVLGLLPADPGRCGPRRSCSTGWSSDCEARCRPAEENWP